MLPLMILYYLSINYCCTHQWDMITGLFLASVQTFDKRLHVPRCVLISTFVTFGVHNAIHVFMKPNGIEYVHHFGSLSSMEQANYDAMIPDLGKQIQKGIDFVHKS